MTTQLYPNGDIYNSTEENKLAGPTDYRTEESVTENTTNIEKILPSAIAPTNIIVGETTFNVTLALNQDGSVSGYNINNLVNPTLNMVRGAVYIFYVDTPDHPLWFRTTATIGTGSSLSGVQNNGTDSNTITFTVPLNCPSTIYYNSQFSSGLRGAINVTGPGSIGNTGYTGSRGFAGYTGSRGLPGSSGQRGETGFAGSRGSNGPSGPSGPVGFTGSRGASGPIGGVGFTGSRGFTGAVGFAGSAGPIGNPGTRGDLGYTGSRGNPGPSGPIGPGGVAGPAGPSGLRGAQGATGPRGYTGSASTEAGYAGSRGAVGFTGSIGAGYDGSRGDQGFKGDVGFTGSRGPVGFAGSASTVVGPQGPVGFAGSRGDVGYAGSASTVVGYAGSAGLAPPFRIFQPFASATIGGWTWVGDSDIVTNGEVTLFRGFTYRFNVDYNTNAGAEFCIKTNPVTGTGSTYNDGVTNNGISAGTITFTVPHNAPNLLYYVSRVYPNYKGNLKIVNVPTTSGGSGGSTTLSSLTDVTISGLGNGQVLTYNGSKWVNESPTVVVDWLDGWPTGPLNQTTGHQLGQLWYPADADTANQGLRIWNGSQWILTNSASGGGGGPTTGLATRGNVAFTTAANLNATVSGFKSYALLGIKTNAPAWVTIYNSVAARTVDATRSPSSDPQPTAGVLAEVITTAAETVYFSPAVICYNVDSTVNIHIRSRSFNPGVSFTPGNTPVNGEIIILRLES